MEDNFSIDEILSAVDDLQNLKRNKTKKVSSVSNAKTDNSEIPKTVSYTHLTLPTITEV